MICECLHYSQKDGSVLPWPDAQPCWSPAMAEKHCVWHEASPIEQPCDSASLLLKNILKDKIHFRN